MTGAASKFLMLLSTPFPLLYRRPYALRLARLSTTAGATSRRLYPANSRRSPPFILRSTDQFHSQTTVREDLDLSVSATSQRALQPSLEWLKLVDHLMVGGYSSRISAVSEEDDDSISASEDLPVDFARAAEACLSFARDRPELLRLLSKKDIEVIVENGSPFLFKNGAASARRMSLFLSGDESVVLESERARTVDIIRYLLSYVWKPLAKSDKNNIDSGEHIETSVRNLLNELVNVSGTVRESIFTHSTSSQSSLIHEPFARRPGQNIEMKRGDWICAKCSFMNFARNIRCLECNEGRPKSQLSGGEWECPQCDFFNYGRNMSCLRCDCKRPGGTPSVTGATGSGLFSKPSFEHILNGSSGDKPEIDRNLAANKTLDRILGRSSTTPETSNTSASVTGNRSNFSDDKQAAAGQPRDSDYVPFVPFPANTFTRLGDTLQSPNKDAPSSAEISKLSDSLAKISDSQTGIKPEKDPSDASESWFKNPGRIDNVMDPVIAASDDDFPDIMPMRKGENRFVVNKKKDRSLTSPQHKRRLAMEQANTSDFVPFVPFPPDYFAKKDKNTKSVPGVAQPAVENPVPPKLVHQGSNENPLETKPDSVFGARTSAMNQAPPHSYSNNRDGWNRGSPQMNNSFNGPSASRASQPPENPQTSRESWKFSGKSLEGSAVSKEPDPLDMSEEAKAERWFRRVAQIKDISELSQIPDEDFPEIMPMRKGVNRFVVSKRKTPLERRLTSPQYRRNLPVVNSDPEKDANSENNQEFGTRERSHNG